MLPFYSTVLTPEEQKEIEEIYPEELTEELTKVKDPRVLGPPPEAGDHGPWGLHLGMGLNMHLSPPSGDSELHRDGEFLEEVQQSETGATEPPAQTCPVVRNQ